MDQGKILTEDSPQGLIQRYCPGHSLALPDTIPEESLKDLDWPVEHQGKHWRIQTDDIPASLNALLARQLDLSALTIYSPSLEDVFLTLTGRSLRE